ncbi:phage major capsid protein [Anatilimnocola floriformis]|uniref:phage major capsid protein n=1 Tax=Anatilimnocola floriformis TaxID=2948575 RepID=UPI0020C249CB|nr:phage major capsid protein [Anatilimnocola floriformis]
MSDLKQLQEERADIIRGLQDLTATVEKRGGAFSEDEKERFDKDMARQADVEGKIDSIRRSQQVLALNSKDVEHVDPARNYCAAKNMEKEQHFTRGWLAYHSDRKDLVRDSHRQAAYDLGYNLSDPEFVFRNQVVGTDNVGGYLRQPNQLVGLEKALKWFGGITSVCDVVPSSNGSPTYIATVNDTGNVGAATNELGTAANVSIAVGKIDFNYHKISTAVFEVSEELITDSEFPFEDMVAELMGERLARAIATHSTTGNLTNNKGFVTESVFGHTVATPTALTVDDFIDLEASVDPAYRIDPSTRYYMNANTFSYCKKLVDDLGRPLLMQDYANANLQKINGYEVLICNDIADIGAGNKSVLFGPASKVRYRPVTNGTGIKRLSELYALNNSVGFTSFQRFSQRTKQPNAMKHLIHALS